MPKRYFRCNPGIISVQIKRWSMVFSAIAALMAFGHSAGAADAPCPTRTPPGVLPAIGCWFWSLDEFEPEGYRPFLDLAARHTAYNLLTTSLRVPKHEMTDRDVHDRISAAAAYARERGMGLAVDLDVRMARTQFKERWPEEQQEMLRLRETALDASKETELAIASSELGDHYTYKATPYLPLAGRLVRVYSYVRGSEGIDPATVRDITDACRVGEATSQTVRVAIPAEAQRHACVCAAFRHFTPDVFAPHLLEYQREIFRQYADAGLAGTCKDEWGFPPCYDGCPEKNDYWFSRFRAEAYAAQTGGRDLVRDCLLMTFGERGRERERQGAINRFLQMSRERNAAIEGDFYDATKEIFGSDAYVGTHPTWFPYPGVREFKKNGLDWWAVRRDLAQTDELTPFSCRTALAKKWGSAVWYNMYYSSEKASYEREIWSHALGGGRINFHPVYPSSHPRGWTRRTLMQGGLMRGVSRIRLLDFITTSPIDCPVAVVFGHACAMNWAGPAYDDVGLALSDALWRAGFYADLIPTSEIASGALKVGADGRLRYGAQSYAAAVLYHPEFELPGTAALFSRAENTALYRIGDWTADFEGKTFDGIAALPKSMTGMENAEACAKRIIAHLTALGIEPQTPATAMVPNPFGPPSPTPPRQGHCRLLDGTYAILSGAEDVAGDPIRATFQANGHAIEVDAIGLTAVRSSKDGAFDALAAGGLRKLKTGDFQIELDSPADVALWRDSDGNWRGVLQGYAGAVPKPLLALTSNWLRLDVPEPLAE